ncbi:MAG: 30S ribosomal protein S20 [Verrucomicrobiota bacterium]|nr:30S ribosomal protein S20 [Verrucomicrobiota bacterium]
MPNTKSAAKRVRTSGERRAMNRASKGKIGAARVRFLKAVSGGSQGEAIGMFKEFCSAVDKALKRGVIKANAAARKKSRAAARLNGLISSQPTA